MNPGKEPTVTHIHSFTRVVQPYRKMKKQFDGNKEESSAPRAFRGIEVYDMVKDIDVVLGKGRKLKTRQKNIWKKRSIFWDLRYG